MVHGPEPGDDGDLGIKDLPVAALPAQLAHRLDDVAGTDGIGLREQAAVGVRGQRAGRADRSTGDELGAFSLLGEAEVLESGG